MSKIRSLVSHPKDDIETILLRILQYSQHKIESKSIPWLLNTEFAGRTLFLDMYLNGEQEQITICHSDETIGFWTGGIRSLLNIKCCKILEQILEDNDINHVKKWS